jgi:hypothetical protein
MVVAGGLVLIQLQDGTLMTYDCINSQISASAFSDATIGANPIISLMYLGEYYYVLYSSGIM